MTKDSVEDVNTAQFNFTNRGVKSCTLDMKHPEGIEIFKNLVKVSDALITNYAPQVLPSWGLDYDELKKIKPDLILVTLPAFGSVGPDKDYVSYASTIEAIAGLNASFGYPGEPPVLSGTYPADPIGAIYGVVGLLAALNYRVDHGLFCSTLCAGKWLAEHHGFKRHLDHTAKPSSAKESDGSCD